MADDLNDEERREIERMGALLCAAVRDAAKGLPLDIRVRVHPPVTREGFVIAASYTGGGEAEERDWYAFCAGVPDRLRAAGFEPSGDRATFSEPDMGVPRVRWFAVRIDGRTILGGRMPPPTLDGANGRMTEES